MLGLEDSEMSEPPSEPPLTLEDLVARITDENRHEEVDWGPPVGREILEPEDMAVLSPEEEQDLWESMEEIRRGEFIDGRDLLSELSSRRIGVDDQSDSGTIEKRDE
jgi:hypothetical protein